LGISDQPDRTTLDQLSELLNQSIMFPIYSRQLYYYVREGYVSHDNSFSWRSEGFCQELKVINEIINGRVLIDGFFTYDLEIGS